MQEYFKDREGDCQEVAGEPCFGRGGPSLDTGVSDPYAGKIVMTGQDVDLDLVDDAPPDVKLGTLRCSFCRILRCAYFAREDHSLVVRAPEEHKPSS